MYQAKEADCLAVFVTNESTQNVFFDDMAFSIEILEVIQD